MATPISEGVRLYQAKRYADALAFFLAASNDEGCNDDVIYYIGLCYVRLARYDDALLYLEQIVTDEANLARVYQCRLLLALIYTKTMRSRLAETELQTLIDSGYESAQVFAALAFSASQQERIDEAVDWYEKALALDGNNTTALNGLGYILACNNRDLIKALSLCKKAVAAAPESAVYLDSLGWVYFKLGLAKDAEKAIAEARVLDPQNRDISDHYTQIFRQIEKD